MQLTDDQAGRVRRRIGRIGECLNRLIDSTDSRFLTRTFGEIIDQAAIAMDAIDVWEKSVEADVNYETTLLDDKGVSS